MIQGGSRETRYRGLSGKHVFKIRILKNLAKFRSLIIINVTFLLLFEQSTNLNRITILPFNNYNDCNTNACLLLPVTSLHYIQIKQKQTGFKNCCNYSKNFFSSKFFNIQIMNEKFFVVPA